MRRVVLTCTAVAAAVGCKGGSSRRDDAGPTRVLTIPAPGRDAARATIAFPQELRFTVLEGGEGVRARRRYRFGGAAARELRARSTVTGRENVDGMWRDPATAPRVADGFGISAAIEGDGGVVHLRGLVAEVDGAQSYVTRWRALLEKRRADVRVDARGRWRDAELLDDPAGTQLDARDELVQRWLGLAVPLPDEPIAPGARWRVVTALRAGGVVLKQTATYQLVAVAPDAWTVDVTIERIGEPQEIVVPGPQPVALGELIALRRVVTGTLVVSPDDPLPIRGRLASEVASHARIRVGASLSERYSEDQATVELSTSP